MRIVIPLFAGLIISPIVEGIWPAFELPKHTFMHTDTHTCLRSRASGLLEAHLANPDLGHLSLGLPRLLLIPITLACLLDLSQAQNLALQAHHCVCMCMYACMHLWLIFLFKQLVGICKAFERVFKHINKRSANNLTFTIRV